VYQKYSFSANCICRGELIWLPEPVSSALSRFEDVPQRGCGRLYGSLAEGGSEGSPMADMPWGAYWGVTLDRYGIRWMINHSPAS